MSAGVEAIVGLIVAAVVAAIAWFTRNSARAQREVVRMRDLENQRKAEREARQLEVQRVEAVTRARSHEAAQEAAREMKEIELRTEALRQNAPQTEAEALAESERALKESIEAEKTLADAFDTTGGSKR